MVHAAFALFALAALVPPTTSAGATTVPSPSFTSGSYWCGHFDHLSGEAGARVRSCPVPNPSPVALVNDAPNGPFSSGQYIDVAVAPNPVLKTGRRVYIEECSVPGGTLPRSAEKCDQRTVQHDEVVVGRHGAVSYQGYPIMALPDATLLGEHSGHTPVCDLTHACVLSISEDRDDFHQPHVWSLPFYVAPTAGDTGAEPGNGLPEVPSVLALPVIAGAIFGGALLVRRRAGRRAKRYLHSMRA
jgi:hypothetical protein